MRLKTFVLGIICCAFFGSCKKTIQQQQENAVISIMTSGTWYVQQYLIDSIDISSSFNGYVFQFNKNGTVTGTVGSVSTSGTWVANINNYSITANFPSASSPLNKLNTIWTITDSGLTYVVANGTVTDSTANLRLQKN